MPDSLHYLFMNVQYKVRYLMCKHITTVFGTLRTIFPLYFTIAILDFLPRQIFDNKTLNIF